VACQETGDSPGCAIDSLPALQMKSLNGIVSHTIDKKGLDQAKVFGALPSEQAFPVSLSEPPHTLADYFSNPSFL
jgi:hypothetical protein